jgi:fumarylpyruvate hydrolase
MSSTELVVPAPPPATVAVRGTAARYPVSRIFCVGRNYAAHAREMGGDPSREAPFFFGKSPRSLLASGGVLPYPPGTRDLHHEIELVVALGGPAFQVDAAAAAEAIYGYAVGLDMTRRDLQAAAKQSGRPWLLGKDGEGLAVLSEVVPAALIGHPTAGRVHLEVNGEVRQDADLADLIWSVPEVLAHLSRFYHLEAGDIVYTGTPAGVSAVVPGDHLVGGVEGVGRIELRIG